MEKRWELAEVSSSEKVSKLAKELNIRDELASLIVQRGISTFEDAKNFFRPSLDHLHDPFAMKNMDKAVNRLGDAIASGEKIMIYGDYDVDGTTSVSLLYGFLKNFSSNLMYYIPDRYTEGYGISEQGVRKARIEEVTLIIALDCGIRAIRQAELAKELGIDLIICDHHLPGEQLPDAYAILDPKQSDDQYHYKELSGCGVGFKLLQGFCIQNSIEAEELYQFLDLVAVSIASDIVPITGENRILAYYGIKKLNHSPCPGLKALIDISGLKNELDVTSIVFYLGPRINATGRLTHAHESVKLLTAADEVDTEKYAEVLNAQNTERRDFDKTITEEALEMVDKNEQLKQAKSTVLFKKDWHKGVVGIVASRCIEHYYRPTIILTESEKKATGSARSVEGFDIHEAISACSDLLEQFGGHTHAAGLTLPLENIPAFQKKFEEVVSASITPEMLQAKVEIDLEVDFSFINYNSYNIIRQMAPFGPKNLKPVLMTRNVKLKKAPKVIKESHLKFTVYQDHISSSFEVIAFGMADLAEPLKAADSFEMAYQLEENIFRGNKSLQLNVKDIKFA